MTGSISQTADGNQNLQVAIKEFHANVSNISSILANAIGDIAKITYASSTISNDVKPYGIDEKIEYNQLNTFKPILEEYGQYGNQIDGIYDSYQESQTNFKKSVYQYFRAKYLLEQQSLLAANKGKSLIEVVRAHSDDILRKVFEQFKADLLATNNLKVSMEDIDTCALAVVCHAFIQCKILEKPVS